MDHKIEVKDDEKWQRENRRKRLLHTAASSNGAPKNKSFITVGIVLNCLFRIYCPLFTKNFFPTLNIKIVAKSDVR